jgi:pimeloyl-ACP methyl ester carboxylesterase
VQQFASDVAGLLQALNTGPAHICGISMGGMIAFQLAVDFPDLVRSLVIVNSGPAMILKKPSQRALIGLRFLIVRCLGMRAMGKTVAKALFPNPEQKLLRETFIDRVAENDPRAYLDSIRAINGWSVTDRISGIRCPVLVLASDHDYTPVEMKLEYAALIPGAEVAILKDSRHAAPLDQPAEFNRVVLEFLARAATLIR